MQLTRFCLIALIGAAAGPLAAQPATCERPAGAAEWLPCGGEHVLSDDELRQLLAHPGEATQIAMTGGGSGHKFNLVLRSGGKLDMRAGNGRDFGREWKIEGGKLCLRVYGGWGGDFNCGSIESKDGRLWWLDPQDSSRNAFDNVSYVK